MPTGHRRGVTSWAGASTTTRCCTRWLRWWTRRIPRGCRIARLRARRGATGSVGVGSRSRGVGWLRSEEPREVEVDAGDRVHGPDRVEDLERVVRALEFDVDHRLPARGAQLLDERTRFFDRRERVEVAVDDERRRRSRVNVEQRRGMLVD